MRGRAQGPAAGGRMEAGPARGAGRLRRTVGSPLQIALLLASFVLTAYAGVRLLADDWLGVAVWFVGAALLHDLVLLPLYSVADRVPRLAGRYVNHLRIPALFSLLLLLVWFPLITGPADRYAKVTGRPEGNNGYAMHWLWLTVALFAVSGIWLAARTAFERRHRRRVVQGRRRATKDRPPHSH